MRLSTIALALQVGTTYAAFAPTTTTTTFSTDMKLLAAAAAEEEDDGKVTVRFINYNRAGETAVKHVDKGTNVLNVADSAGVHIPRNCRSGLCGSCTADMIDPSWTVGDRPGFQTVRICAAGAITPAGCDEMVIDCWRQTSTSPEMDENGLPIESSQKEIGGALDRFGDNWEADFKPDFRSGGSGLRAFEDKPVNTGKTKKLLRRRRDSKEWNCRDITDRVGRVSIGEDEGVPYWSITEPTNWGI